MGTRLASYHSNVIHAANTTSGIAEASPSIFSNNGQMDCETMESLIGPGDGSTYGTSVGALDCLDSATAISYASNPQFVNMYTVKKISFEPASYDTADNALQVDEAIQGGTSGINSEK